MRLGILAALNIGTPMASTPVTALCAGPSGAAAEYRDLAPGAVERRETRLGGKWGTPPERGAL